MSFSRWRGASAFDGRLTLEPPTSNVDVTAHRRHEEFASFLESGRPCADGEVPCVGRELHPTQMAGRPSPEAIDAVYIERMRILAISGSLQSKSSNLELLRTAAALAPEGVEVV